jgi:hypothetical protein
MSNTLSLALEGEASLHQYREAVDHFLQLLQDLTHEVVPHTEIRWLVDDLQTGSSIGTFAESIADPNAIGKVINAYDEIGKALETNKVIPFSPRIKQSATNLTKVIGGGVAALRFETEQSDAIIYGVLDEKHPTPRTTRAFGTVKGTVHMLTNLGGPRFTLYDHLYNKPVNCYLSADQADLMREFFGKYVYVTGMVSREAQAGRPIKVTQITDISPVKEVEPGSYKLAEGVLAPYDDGELPEITLRRLRDNE